MVGWGSADWVRNLNVDDLAAGVATDHRGNHGLPVDGGNQRRLTVHAESSQHEPSLHVNTLTDREGETTCGTCVADSARKRDEAKVTEENHIPSLTSRCVLLVYLQQEIQ